MKESELKLNFSVTSVHVSFDSAHSWPEVALSELLTMFEKALSPAVNIDYYVW